MTDPGFSIVVPAFNAARTIDTCIRSALGQTSRSLEVLVVDDGSTDATAQIAGRYAEADPRVQLLSQRNAGPWTARNRGISHARGSLIGFIDSDDAWLPGYVAAIEARAAAAPDAGLFYADCWSLLDRGKLINRLTTLQSFPAVDSGETPQQVLSRLIAVNFITTSSVAVSRVALDTVGSFATTLAASEDWDLWLRIASAGYRCTRVGTEPLVLLRETDASLSKDAPRMALSAVQVMERVLALQAPGTAAHELAGERLLALRGDLRRIVDPTPRQRAMIRVRAALGPLKRALLHRRTWRPPPADLRARLHDLGEL